METEKFVKAPRFGVVRGESPQYAIASMALADSAMKFVMGGFGQSIAIEVDAFNNCLKAAFFECLAGCATGMDSKHYKYLEKGRTHEDFCLLSWGSLVATQLEWAERLSLGKAVPMFAQNIDDDLAEGVVLSAGGEVLKGVLAGQPNLATAWEIARLNIKRVEARICLAFTLKDAAKARGEKINCRTAESQIGMVIDSLYNQLTNARMQMFAVGTLVGESAQVDLKTLAKDIYAEGVGVMHLLHLDGYLPGSYRTADEAAIRAAIRQS